MNTPQNVARYHPLLVTLHWTLAVLIVGMLIFGFLILAPTPNDDSKLTLLALHMATGMLILALMVIRLIVRLRMARPAPATTGHPLLDRLARVVHYGFYVVVVLMVSSGYATAIIAGLNRIVFQRSGEPLPTDFDVYPTLVAHGFLAVLLAAMIGLHVLAALYHHFIRKDGLIGRMTFGGN